MTFQPVSGMSDFSQAGLSSGTMNAETPRGSPSRTVLAATIIPWACASIVDRRLLPRQHVAVAVGDRRRGDRAGVGAGLGLGQPKET
jgi:hypothetical protein